MQKGGGRKTSSCWLYKSIESELGDFISYGTCTQTCKMFGYSEDGVTRQAVNRGHDLIKSRGGGFKIAVCHKNLMKFCLLI